MPNWCHNKITLSHDDATQIERVKDCLSAELQIEEL